MAKTSSSSSVAKEASAAKEANAASSRAARTDNALPEETGLAAAAAAAAAASQEGEVTNTTSATSIISMTGSTCSSIGGGGAQEAPPGLPAINPSTSTTTTSRAGAGGIAMGIAVEGGQAPVDMPPEIVCEQTSTSTATTAQEEHKHRLSSTSTATMPAHVLEKIIASRMDPADYVDEADEEAAAAAAAAAADKKPQQQQQSSKDRLLQGTQQIVKTDQLGRLSSNSRMTMEDIKSLEIMSSMKSARVTQQFDDDYVHSEPADVDEPGAFAVSTTMTTEGHDTPTNILPPTAAAIARVHDHHDGATTTVCATAFQVEDSQVEEEMRNRILAEAVEADIVLPEDQLRSSPHNSSSDKTTRWKRLVAIMALLLVIVIVVAVAVPAVKSRPGSSSGDQLGATTLGVSTTVAPTVDSTRPTLEVVRERGTVRCGIFLDVIGFSNPNKVTGEMEGMNIDHCRAISIAVFGTPNNIELVTVVSKDRFPKLANMDFDVLTGTTTHTMDRQVFEPTSQSGFAFSTPFFYAGLIFGGLPAFVDCAENRDSLRGICRSLKVCVITGTTHELLLRELFPGGFVVPSDDVQTMIQTFVNGTCHLMASEAPNIPSVLITDSGFEGEFRQGQNLFSREPLSLVTRPNDSEWTNLVNMVVNIFYLAEANNITKSNADDIQALLHTEGGGDFGRKMQAIVKEFGNYADLYQKHLEGVIPRGGLSLLYDKHSTDLQASRGLMFSYPFGVVDTRGEGLIPGRRLDRILSRGYLKCGVLLPGYGDAGVVRLETGALSGLNVQFCRALAAALFAGDTEAVELVELDSGMGTMISVTPLLDDGNVDVVAGAPVTLQADYLGYTFSSPYYYYREDDNNALYGLALMTLDHDSQWSDFCFWVVMAMVYAEENAIGPETIAEMPVVNLFGEGLKQMLRDCVFGIGTYGDIYNQTVLQSTGVPRAGANLLNQGPTFGPQQFAVPFR